MKSDFRKFRLYCRLSIVFVVLAMVAFHCCNIFIGGALGAAIGMTLFIMVGAVAAVLEWLAYDNLLCPKCGQRVAIPHRNSFDKENRARYRAISKGEPVVCVHCGAKIETKCID
jgi:DNA-directed RNA polymerase subunit RPC12/RpoP